jgi:hypothetical protein
LLQAAAEDAALEAAILEVKHNAEPTKEAAEGAAIDARFANKKVTNFNLTNLDFHLLMLYAC